MDCWEFMKCGREKGGIKEKEFGCCPAYPDNGKECARIAGTFCGGEIQGVFAVKLADCLACGFYNSENYNKLYEKQQ